MKVYHTTMDVLNFPATIFIGAPVPEGYLVGTATHLTDEEIQEYIADRRNFTGRQNYPLTEKTGEVTRAVLVLDTEA